MTAAAKRLALENGVSISSLKGTGPGGKITEEDVKKASSGPAAGASRRTCVCSGTALVELGSAAVSVRILLEIPQRPGESTCSKARCGHRPSPTEGWPA